MARVVQKRSGPPYLLIVFVFLFLLATTLAVLFYVENDKNKKLHADGQAEMALLADSRDLKSDKVRKLKDAARKKTGGGQRQTVIGQLLLQAGKLSHAITGEESGFENANRMAEKALDMVKGSRVGLAKQVELLLKEQKSNRDEIQNLNEQLGRKEVANAKKDKQIATIIAEHESNINKLGQKVTELDNKFDSREKKHKSDLANADQSFKESLKEQVKNSVMLAQRIEELRRDSLKKDRLIGELKKKLSRDPTRVRPEGVFPADGKILRVLEGQKLCYISIGRNDRVSEGLPFAVYPHTGIPKDGKGKAKLVVSRVSPNVSECRILEESQEDPVVAGDLIGNVAFGRKRIHVFVVEGHFDLYGTGTPNAVGAEEVKGLIKRFGGKVTDELDVQTDYLVLGTEPDPPQKPKEEAPQPVWKTYRDQLKVYNRYQRISELARDINVPVLNTNRFLAFVGFTPTTVSR